MASPASAASSAAPFQFAFTNGGGAVFGTLAATNVSLRLSNWTALSGVTKVSPGHFQFSNPQAPKIPRVSTASGPTKNLTDPNRGN